MGHFVLHWWGGWKCEYNMYGGQSVIGSGHAVQNTMVTCRQVGKELGVSISSM